MVRSLYYIFKCDSCPFYLYLKEVGLLLLIPLQVFLFLKLRKEGWILSLFTAVIQIAASLWVILEQGSYYSHEMNFSVPVAYAVVTGFAAVAVFLLQKKTMQHFNITYTELVSTLIISVITGIVYYHYLSSVMYT